MARATADGAKIRVECTAGTFYLEHWEARELATELRIAVHMATTDDYKDATHQQFEQAVVEHRAWLAQRRAELGIEED